jgi:hypothetical protein
MTALTSLLSATLALGFAAAPLPSYRPLDPGQLILQADLIVEGTITSVDATFTIRVDGSICEQ